jgi:itaconate CoA-transferase
VRGLASYFVWLNRSKESVTLDLKQPDGREVLDSLLSRADVFVQNLAPRATARMGLSFDDLHTANPGLIVCDISGYGSSGPYRDRRAYDLLVQCETGLMSVTGTPESPAKAGISIADIAAGMYAYSAVLTALFARERTGTGVRLEVSLFDSLTEWMSQPMYYAMYSGAAPERTGTSHATIAPYGTFRTGGGGAVQLAVQNDREWRRLCAQVIDRPDLTEDERYASNPARVEHRTELCAEIEAAFAGLTAADVVERLDRAQIANGRFNEVADVLEHPQLEGRWCEIDSPAGPIRALRPPARMSGHEAVMGAVPAVGDHTAAVLAELGYSGDDLRRLRVSGAV